MHYLSVCVVLPLTRMTRRFPSSESLMDYESAGSHKSTSFADGAKQSAAVALSALPPVYEDLPGSNEALTESLEIEPRISQKYLSAPPKSSGQDKLKFNRRCSDKVLGAFHKACDDSDIGVASSLIKIVELMIERTRTQARFERRVNLEKFVAAHERLWHLKRSMSFAGDSQSGGSSRFTFAMEEQGICFNAPTAAPSG